MFLIIILIIKTALSTIYITLSFIKQVIYINITRHIAILDYIAFYITFNTLEGYFNILK
jgi:hypothetical protein